jgi:hypothetical protein
VSMVNPKIVDAKDIKRHVRKAPATRLIESLPPDLLTARQVATHFDVSIETIRRLGRATLSDGSPKFNAPSKAARTGDLIVWLYTKADMTELAEYFGKKEPSTNNKRNARKSK